MAAAIKISQITGPPLAKSVGMGSLKAVAGEVQSAKFNVRETSLKPLPNPSWVAAAVNDGMDENCFIGNRVINREGKFFGQQPVKVFMRPQMDPRVTRERINVRINVFEKVRTQPGLL
jgi:hypothetical protein